MPGKSRTGWGGAALIIIAALVLSWSWVLYWKQLFHPGLTFISAFLYLTPSLALVHAGLSRLGAGLTSLTLPQSRRLNFLTYIVFLPLVAFCLKRSFSRPAVLTSLGLYLLVNLIWMLIYLDRGKLSKSRGIFLNLGCALLLAGLVFLSYYKFFRLDYYFLHSCASHWCYKLNLFMGRSISQGIFPLWSPYHGLGLLPHPESQRFFPLIILVAIFSRAYGFYHYLILTYVASQSIGAIGFFALAKYLVRRRWIAFIVAGAYAFSGFAVYQTDITPHYAVAWLPYIILFSLKAIISREKNFRFCVAAGFFLGLMNVSSYPILWLGTVINVTLLSFILWLIGVRRHCSFLKLAVRLLLIVGLAAAFSAPYIAFAREYVSFSIKQEREPYAIAVATNNLTPRSVLSLLFPSTALFLSREEIIRGGGNEAVFDMETFNGQDFNNRSIYFTLPCLFFALIGLVQWTRYRGLPLLFGGFAFFYLLMSLGGHSFFYEIFYYFVPFFSSARHSAIHRLFFIFYMLLLAASGLRVTFRNIRNQFLDRVAPGVISGFIFVFICFETMLLAAILRDFRGELTLYSHMFHDVTFGLLFSGGTLVFLLHRRTVKYRAAVVIGLAVLVLGDGMNFAQARHRVQIKKADVRYEESLGVFKKDFSLVPNTRKYSTCWTDVNWVHDFSFVAGFSTHVYNPPRYTFEILKVIGDRYRHYTDRLFNLYSEAEYSPWNNMLRRMDEDVSKAYLSPDTEVPRWFPGEQAGGEGEDKLQILWYAPNEARVKVETANGCLLEMVDTYHPDWSAFLDGIEVPIHRINYCWKGVFIPPGVHEVSFIFDPPIFLPSVLLSALFFCGAIFLCLIPRSDRRG